MWSRWEQMETDGDREIEKLAESLELSLFWKGACAHLCSCIFRSKSVLLIILDHLTLLLEVEDSVSLQIITKFQQKI